LRLTHIKLTGFKSFVDPTVIPVNGQRVGVVGPNGCGKSNVIDAVRWVLGESRARELRGESMQDVIFNGAATRKPVSRASVELLFDNSRGRAGGQWSQYAEIAVKRVLTRDGTSAYYINNVHVRRRDVADVFLGTGLGGHGYAIIEQGMISAIVEARPEELRAYLEEAAGISKYKERRRETELRLRDTHENLARVSDIQAELAARIEKLEGQAAVARRYFELKSQLDVARRLYWLARKQEAAIQRQKLDRDIAAQHSALEALNAHVAEVERETESLRQQHYAASDAVNVAQGEYYAATSEVGRLESELTHLRDTRRRIETERGALQQKHALLAAEEEGLRAHSQQLEDERAAVDAKLSQLVLSLESARLALPGAEAAWREAQRKAADLQRELTQVEHGMQVEETHFGHSSRILQQLEGRRARLAEEISGLPEPEPARLAVCESELETARKALGGLEAEHARLVDTIPVLEAEQREAAGRADTLTASLHRLQAQAAALEKLQEQAGHGQARMREWFSDAGWHDCPQLWQAMEVESGWETAVEAALGHRVRAVLLQAHTSWAHQTVTSPPETVTLGLSDVLPAHAPESVLPGVDLLRTKVRARSAEANVLLDDWLTACHVAQSEDEAETRHAQLPPGALLVTPEGRLYSRSSLTLPGTQDLEHGILVRQKELEQIRNEAARLQAELDEERARRHDVEDRLRVFRDRLDRLHTEMRLAQSGIDQQQNEAMRLSEMIQRIRARREQIEADVLEIAAQVERENSARGEAEATMASLKRERDALRAFLDDARASGEEAEQHYHATRDEVLVREREHREACFMSDTLKQRIEDLASRLQLLSKQASELDESDNRLSGELGALLEEPLVGQVQAALEIRKKAEQGLAERRDRMESLIAAVSGLEQDRMRVAQQVQPMREKLEQLKLKYRETEILESQCDEQLSELPDADVGQHINKLAKANEYKEVVSEREADIEALGAVNLAALEELKSFEERKHYLDAQFTDLNDAANTMIDAIGRIDREMRARLKDTYDNVNKLFGQFFGDIFGGGQASLLLTGEELLDAGLVVTAQPPGKKNASIHLLSGGEKALTALSLIFAMFSLNPAPFCLLDEVDAPLDDTNTERLCRLIEKMSCDIQFLFITHNKITMETAQQLIGVTMQEAGVSRTVAVDVEEATAMAA
jgi:chromosome segregation protein